MDPKTAFCLNLACPARGQTGQGNIGIHSRKDKRCICRQCRQTFTVTKGTGFYRLRTAAETVVIVVTLLAYGCPVWLKNPNACFLQCLQTCHRLLNVLISSSLSPKLTRHRAPKD